MTKRTAFKITLLLIALLVSVSLAWAQDEVTAVVEPGKTDLTIGDAIPLTLRVTHPAGWRVIVPEMGQQWGDYEIRSQGLPTITGNDGTNEISTVLLEVSIYAVGTFETPALDFEIVTADGRVLPQQVAPISLTINSVLVEGDTQLRDIKPQAALEVPVISPLVYAGAAFAVALVVGGIVLFARRPRAVKPVIDTRTPYQRARDELNHIEDLRLLDQGLYQEHYQRTSDCMRRLFEEVYEFAATDLTTVEIKRWLTHMGLPLDFIRYTVDLLKDCDLIKYANTAPDPQAAAILTTRAHHIIFAIEPIPASRKTGTTERVA